MHEFAEMVPMLWPSEYASEGCPLDTFLAPTYVVADITAFACWPVVPHQTLSPRVGEYVYRVERGDDAPTVRQWIDRGLFVPPDTSAAAAERGVPLPWLFAVTAGRSAMLAGECLSEQRLAEEHLLCVDTAEALLRVASAALYAYNSAGEDGVDNVIFASFSGGELRFEAFAVPKELAKGLLRPVWTVRPLENPTELTCARREKFASGCPLDRGRREELASGCPLIPTSELAHIYEDKVLGSLNLNGDV